MHAQLQERAGRIIVAGTHIKRIEGCNLVEICGVVLETKHASGSRTDLKNVAQVLGYYNAKEELVT